ncbi:MAG: DUF3857 domain-containing protein [Cyclobacteriaceae bacterium]|nr:DUF3857 domain-containing protein [Cyclobacteriaceae bacterium]
MAHGNNRSFAFVLIPGLFIFCTPCTGQKIRPTFGILSEVERKLTAPSDEPDAEALVVFDIGSSRFMSAGSEGLDIHFTRMKRVKIFKRSGARHAAVSIPFYRESANSTEKVEDIDAIAFNEESGQTIIRRLDPTTIFEEQVSENVRVKKFVLPDVKEGTIIDFRYTVITPFLFNLPDWNFQSEIPTRYSEYSVGMTPFYEYDFIAQGMTKFDYQNSEPEFPKKSYGDIRYNDMVTTFILKDTPSFTNESFITSAEDCILKIDFQLSKVNRVDGTYKEYKTNWPNMCKSMLEHEDFGKYFNSCKKYGKDIVEDELKLTGPPDAKKAKAIIDYVRSNFTWTGHYGRYATKSAKAVITQKTGNSAELNLLLAATLAAADIDVYLVLMSTRSHGKVHQDYPFEHFFNNVVVFVLGQPTFLTEATEPLLAYDRLPASCMNGNGLIVSKETENWVGLDSKVTSISEITTNIHLNPVDGTALVNGSIASTEYLALDLRKSYLNDTAKLKTMLKESYELEASTASGFNYSNTLRPYIINFSGQAEIETVAGKVVFRPFLDFPPSETGLNREKRTYPVDFNYLRTMKYKSRIIIPSDYRISETPIGISTDDDLIKVTIAFNPTNNGLEATAEYILKKAVYAPQAYTQLKGQLEILVREINKVIILQKK